MTRRKVEIQPPNMLAETPEIPENSELHTSIECEPENIVLHVKSANMGPMICPVTLKEYYPRADILKDKVTIEVPKLYGGLILEKNSKEKPMFTLVYPKEFHSKIPDGLGGFKKHIYKSEI